MKSRNRGRHKRQPTDVSSKSTLYNEKSPRIQLIDYFRGIALLGMTIVHGAWNLEFFGFLAPGTSHQTFWAWFAALVAGSFLGLVGVSLHLAHAHGIRWRSWAKRLGIIVLAAGCVTAVTAVVTPDVFIRFGILHMIAAGSILGIGVLRWPGWVILVSAAVVVVMDFTIPPDWLEGTASYILGFEAVPPTASDYRPIFPWLASVLFGIGGARILGDIEWWEALGRITFSGRIGRGLLWLGRHSLAYYLIHQPILFGFLWAVLKVSG
ncbi:MAG: heparan-alpha-glucosaminide N-acetyltransferase [Gammaproteobacteria bacterium]|nr:heparan-alpha-glucosaminide N-acetyltransferase [Gammaproteobacteria bacterium]MCY4219426.1 heparan-alpha-glucosaminide N-acetyltransferase [Gammaproteobacteria bacterium]MCY4274574.1 heparan-alpha-glucosaminide N-acetyltransferase [Gammaproteobacteria bacterium]